MQSQITIGPEFFGKIKSDYSDWKKAFIREFMQNSIDAPGSQNIWITTELRGDGDTNLVVENDGAPMTEHELLHKLLTLGGSGKANAGTIGGFGVAKSLLYYCHQSYTIHTGSLLVTGSGAQFELTEDVAVLSGTKSSVVVEGDQIAQLTSACRRLAGYTQWSGNLYLNGEKLDTDLRKGSPRREFSWAKIYTNKSFENTLVVRIGGMPMFYRYVDYKGCVIVELTGNSVERLTSNRDSLKYEYLSELESLVHQLSVNKRSALRHQEAQYKLFSGKKLQHSKISKGIFNVRELIGNSRTSETTKTAAFLAVPEAGGGEAGCEPGTQCEPHGGSPERSGQHCQTDGPRRSHAGSLQATAVSRTTSTATIGQQFIIKNTMGMVTPDCYVPGDAFSSYSLKLVKAWGSALLELYKLFDIEDSFSIGFLFDESSEAEFESNNSYGKVYYLAPVSVVCQKGNDQCKSFKKRFAGAWANRHEVLALAVHEFVHGAFEGMSCHDEDYASKLTEVTAVVFKNMNRFTPLFRD